MDHLDTLMNMAIFIKGQSSFLEFADIEYYFDHDNEDNDEVYNPYINIKNGLNQSSKMLFGNMSFEAISIVKKSHLTKRSIKDLIEDLKENFTSVFYKSFDIVYKYLDLAIKFESRNPRAQAVSSKYIYDLFNNRTKNVIILKQGESHVLNTSASIKPEFNLNIFKYMFKL